MKEKGLSIGKQYKKPVNAVMIEYKNAGQQFLFVRTD